MTSSHEESKYSLDDLIEMAARVQSELAAACSSADDAPPFDIICGMAQQILASCLPERKDSLLAGEHNQTIQTFALEMLRINGQPASLWLSAEEQQAAYGGIEPLLFQKLPAGIIAHYAKQLGRNRENDDPATWDATEIG